MALAGKTDEGDRKIDKPWALRVRIDPLRTYSGRVVYDRRMHWFSLADIARISEKVKPLEQKPSIDKYERIWRALHALVMGTAIPFPADWNRPLLDYLKWAIDNSWEVISDPIAALKKRTLELIFALVNLWGLEDDLRDALN